VSQAHDLAHHTEDHLLAQVRRLTAATVHASPAGPTEITRDQCSGEPPRWHRR
jgi:hypothetical protein